MRREPRRYPVIPPPIDRTPATWVLWVEFAAEVVGAVVLTVALLMVFL
jgi:hypothetical protein